MKGKKILVYDFGMSIEHAARLVKDGNEVKYFTPWATGFPKFESYAPGLNFDGLQKVLYFFDEVEWADFIVFFDIGAGDLCSYLRKTLKIPVYGAGIGEKLENHRELMRKIQSKVGLPIQNTRQIQGVPKLREYLQRNPKKFVKLDIFRGDIESFKAEDYDKIKMYLDEIEVALGVFHEQYNFMVEDYVEGIEPGFDLYFNGEKFLKPMLWGFEHAKSCYIGKYVEELPKPLQIVADKLTPVLQKLDFRSACSTEVRITKDLKPYLIDICSRYPFPLSNLFVESIKNYSDVIWGVGNKKDVRLDIAGKYVGAVPLSSEHGKEYWLKLDFPQDLRKYVKIRSGAMFEDEYYAVKGTESIYIIVAYGNSVDEVIAKLEKVTEKVDAFGLDTGTASGLNKIYDVLKDCPKYGLGKF